MNEPIQSIKTIFCSQEWMWVTPIRFVMQVLIFCATKKWAKTCAKKVAAYYGKRARTGRIPAGVTRMGEEEEARLAAGRARLVQELKQCWGSLSGLQRWVVLDCSLLCVNDSMFICKPCASAVWNSLFTTRVSVDEA